MHCCSTVVTDVTSLTSFPTLVTFLAKRTYILGDYCQYVSLQSYETDTEALWGPVRTAVLLFVEFNTAMALAILTEQRDYFVGAGVGQSCGCETTQSDQH